MAVRTANLDCGRWEFVLTDDMRKWLERLDKDAWLLSNEVLEARVQASKEGNVQLIERLMRIDRSIGLTRDMIRRAMDA
jgi:hypothetical protein